MVPNISQLVIAVLGLALMVSCQKEEPAGETPLTGEEVSTKPSLTGIPQIDYIHDPNLPAELNGYNLSSYPFYPTIPPRDKMNFECDGLHDGFYASVVHKCQVYHQCLFGQRYDFLCANFTAFDQKNFICHFANEVDCDNSPKFFDRNEALYKAASTTTEAPQVIVRTRFVGPDGRPARRPGAARFRRPNANRRPVYYDDYYDYEYQDYYDEPVGNEEEEVIASKNSSSPPSDNAVRPDGLTEEEGVAAAKPAKAGGARQQRPNAGQGNRLNIFNNNRPPPRIRPPVPNSEQAKKPAKQAKTTTTTTTPQPADEFYDYGDYAEGEEPVDTSVTTTTTTTTTTTPAPTRRRSRRPKTTTTTTPTPVIEEEFVEEGFEEEVIEPLTTTQRPARARLNGPRRSTTTTTTEATPVVSEEPVDELASSSSTTEFNRRASVNNLLRRRVVGTTSTTEDNTANEEVLADEPIEEVVSEAPTTTTTSGPTRRTTRARPTRPANTPRSRSTETPVVTEEEAPTTVAQVADKTEPAIEVEAPTVRRGRPRRPVPVEDETVATRRDSRDSQVATEEEAPEEIALSENTRQERQLAPESLKSVAEESADFDEDLGESQWSIIHLFSRVFPQRA